jgi:DNA-binding transcriptional regulator YiaG
MTRNTTLGGLLVTWREDRRMKQSALAAHLGITRQRLWDWEQHGVPVNDVELVRLAMRQLRATLERGKDTI